MKEYITDVIQFFQTVYEAFNPQYHVARVKRDFERIDRLAKSGDLASMHFSEFHEQFGIKGESREI